ncbi:MAG TPA: hypothetical protein VF996_00520 [Candidatus Saccharimonadales bacterium]
MNIKLLAHATEFHTEETTQAQHLITEWWFGLSIYAVFLVLVLWALKSKLSFATRISLVLGASLILGLVFYRWTPALSGAAIVVGFFCSLVLGLGSAKKQ